MGGVGGVEGDGPGDRDLGGPPGMDVGRGEEADPRMAVRRVVPGEEGGAEGPGVLERAEAAGKGRPVLEGLELGLAVRVVVGHVGPRVALLDPEVGEQEGDRLAAHRGAPVGVDRELPRLDALLGGGLGDEPFGEDGALARGDHPARHVAGEDVEDHVELVVGPLGRTTELRYIPRPQLVRPGGEELGPGIGGMAELVAPLADLGRRGEDAVHRPLRREVRALIEQGGVHRSRRRIEKAWGMELAEHHGSLGSRQRPRWSGTRHRGTVARAPEVPVVGGPGHGEGGTGTPRARDRGELVDPCGDHRPSFCSALSRESSRKSAETFPWTAITFSARTRRASRRSIAARRRSFSAASGCGAGRPRGPVRPERAPARYNRRHSTRWDLYRPSRRSRALTAPGSAAALASSTIRRLYSAVKRRRTGRSLTSGSGIGKAWPTRARGAKGSSISFVDPLPALAACHLFPAGGCLTRSWQKGLAP